jgi:nucleoside-diphosphate-sugar epimerase
MTILITGGTGFLGSALIDKLLAKGEKIITVSRHSPEPRMNLLPLIGDILKPNLGLEDRYLADSLGKIDSVYHVAGIVDLSENDKNDRIYQTNVIGTKNVVNFCLDNKIPHLFYVSTAYTRSKNPYERSKAEAEILVSNAIIPKVTIFKPSIIMGSKDHFALEHLPLFALYLARIHRRVDLFRRDIEGLAHLPGIEPIFHIRGNPEGEINLVPVESVVDAMVNIKTVGAYWLTNPKPPLIREILDWLGESLLLKLVADQEFQATPIEMVFERITKAFAPYLQGDNFVSDLRECGSITKHTIDDMVHSVLSNSTKN